MRPTAQTMLQQNNNNNYPCLNVSGSTREVLQKCSRASLPFPSRLELGLGDLPLIRGLRAWALCSKNHRKDDEPIGKGQAPIARPAGCRGSTSCPRTAEVYLSGEWGCMGYGLPLGLDSGQAGIGALVTVATLKTSEGSGKTQTQCLFLRTDKGSSLYSKAKPDSGIHSSTTSSVVGGWLRGKTGGGRNRDTSARRRDNGQTEALTGANQVRVRSGRRWRKSCNAVGRVKTSIVRERPQKGSEDPAEEINLEERQEEQDKGSLDSKPFPSQHQSIGRARHEKEEAGLKCCHKSPMKACSQCGRRAQKRESQVESPRRGIPNTLSFEVDGIRKGRQRNEEEEEKRGPCLLEFSDSVDLECNDGCDEGIREAKSEKEIALQTYQSDKGFYSKKQNKTFEVLEIGTNNDAMHGQTAKGIDDFSTIPCGNFEDKKTSGNPSEEKVANAKRFCACMEAHKDSEIDMDGLNVDEGSISHSPVEFSTVCNYCEGVSASTCLNSIVTAVLPVPPTPVEGITFNVHRKTQGEQENRREYLLEGYQRGLADSGIIGKELNVIRLEQQDLNCASDEYNTVNKNKKPLTSSTNVENSSQLKEKAASTAPSSHRDQSIFEADDQIIIEKSCNFSTNELSGTEQTDTPVRVNRVDGSQPENTEQIVNFEEEDETEEIWRRECPCKKHNDGDGRGHKNDINDSILQGDDKEGIRNCALTDSRRVNVDGCRGKREVVGDTCGQTSNIYFRENGKINTNVAMVACANPSTSLELSLANPAPSLPPLGSMATSLPCLEAEKKEEEEWVRATAGEKERGRVGRTRHGRQLEVQDKEERSSTVATKEERKEEDEEDVFGVFMQAEGEPTWIEGSTMSASVPFESRASVALENHAINREPLHWTPGWTDSSFHQSDDIWTAFPQDSADQRRDVLGQWWPNTAVEEIKDGLLNNHNLVSVFAEAFPSLPCSSSCDPCDLDAVPTLNQHLGGRVSQDQGLLDSFHDLNKLIYQRYKRANGVSRDRLLKTLHLEQPRSESRPASRAASRLSPGLPSTNHDAQNTAARRRLSYDYNRNVME